MTYFRFAVTDSTSGKRLDAALAELDDRIDVREVRDRLDELGYRESSPFGSAETRLAAYYWLPLASRSARSGRGTGYS